MQLPHLRYAIIIIIMLNASRSLCCSSNQFTNSSGSCQPCSNALSYCQTCTTGTACTSCATSYTVNSSSQCQLCSNLMPNCSTCTSQTSCATCNDSMLGVDTSASPSVCQLCSITLQHCLSCDNSSVCLACIADSTIHLKVNQTVSGLCVYCNQTFIYCINCTSSKCTLCVNSTTITLFNGSCVPCSTAIPNCVYCQSAIKCIGCANSLFALTYINGSKICKLCAELMSGCIICPNATTCGICSVGFLVKNGCSQVGGCIQVAQLGIKNAICTKCSSSEFIELPVGGVCKCKAGYLTGRICTALRGCKETEPLNISRCKVCSKMDHFVLVQGSCYCKPAFYLDGDQCVQVCGDGLLYNYQCDDGNLIDGDGCSSNCQIQQSYYCPFGSPTSPSRCVFNSSIKISLISILKSENQNAMTITFGVDPQTKLMQRMNLTSFINFNSSARCSLSTAWYDSGKLSLLVNYYETIEFATANLSLSFDPRYINSPTDFIKFELAQSNGQDFYYSPTLTSNSALVQQLCKYLSAFSLLLLLVGSLAHRMIGVETIHAIQLNFLVQIASPNFRSAFFNFKGLLTSLCRIVLFPQTRSKSNLNQYLQYYSKYSESYWPIAIVQLIGLVALAICKMAQWRTQLSQQDNKQDGTQKKEGSISRMKGIIANNYFYPMFLGFFFQFKLVLLNSFYNRSATDKRQISALIIYSIVNYVVFLTFLKDCLASTKKDKNQGPYLLNYLLFTIIVIINIQIQLILPNYLFSYMFTTAIVVHVAFILFNLPYKKGFHNLCILFNYAVLLFNVVWAELQKLGLANNDQFPYEITLAFLLCTIQILSVIRIILQFHEKYQKQCNKEDRQIKNASTSTAIQKTKAFVDNFNNSIAINMHEKLSYEASNNFNIVHFQKNDSKHKEDELLRQRLKAYRELFQKQKLKKKLINL